jgi:hypothetical protein
MNPAERAAGTAGVRPLAGAKRRVADQEGVVPAVAGPGGVIQRVASPPDSGRADRSSMVVQPVVLGDDPEADRRAGVALDRPPAEARRRDGRAPETARPGRLDPAEAGRVAIDPPADATVQHSGGRRADRRGRREDGRPDRPGSPASAARRGTARPVRHARHRTMAAAAPGPRRRRRPCCRLCRRLCRRSSRRLCRPEPPDSSADRRRPWASCPWVDQP